MPPEFRLSSPLAPDAQLLLDALSEQLQARFGGDGRASFLDWDDHEPANVFLLAYRDVAVGCGAIKRIDAETGEVKRMFARPSGVGIGGSLLQELERQARRLAYRRLWLETRLANVQARAFYEHHGYVRRPNYGRYIGRDDCVCYEKDLRG